MAHPPPRNSGDPDQHGPHNTLTTPWPPEDPYVGGGYQQPLLYSPRPPGMYDGAPAHYGTAEPRPRRKNALAVTSMVCALGAPVLMAVGTFELLLVLGVALSAPSSRLPQWDIGPGIAAYGLGILLGVVAVTTGVIALRQVRRSGDRQGGRGMAIVGLTIGIIFLSVVAVFFLLALAMGGS